MIERARIEDVMSASWMLRDNDAEKLVRLSIGIEALATAFARRLEVAARL